MADNPNTYNQQQINRAEQIDSTIKGVTDPSEVLGISLETIDTAIKFYFDNKIQPTIVENGQTIKVPVEYGSKERWASIQENGYMRDQQGRLIGNAIVFTRTDVQKDTELPVTKMDANNPHLYFAVEKKYSQTNRFDQFNILTGQKPVSEYYNVAIPDYIVANYEVIVWTQYVKSMNKIVESIIFSSDAYWGDDTFKFKVSIADIATPVEITTGEDRTLKSTFTLNVKGRLISNTVNRMLANGGGANKKSLGIRKTTIFTETDTNF